MIRINLVPQKRKRSAGSPAPTRAVRSESTEGGGSGAATAVLMLLGWGALAGAGWYLLSIEDEAALAVRANAAVISKNATGE